MEREKVLFRGALFDFVFAKLITYQRYEYYGAVKTPRLRSITKSGASAFREDCLSAHNNGRNQSRHDPQCYFRKYKRCIAVCADQSLLMNVHNPRSSEIAFYSQFDYQVNILCENMSVFNKHIEIGIFAGFSYQLLRFAFRSKNILRVFFHTRI